MEHQLTANAGHQSRIINAEIIPLQQIVGNLLYDSLTAASHNKTEVSNEVGREIELSSNAGKAVMVIEEILRTVIGNSRNGEIHITADRYKDIVVLQVQERNNYNGYALAYSIGSIEPDAAAVGGHITIKGQRQKIATICFSFPSNLLAA